VGFTGKYVGVVWLGNDDNRPMQSGTTGGQMAAPLWHAIMSVAHTNMNIPTIPGLPPHPTQVDEQERIAQLRVNDPNYAAQEAAGDTKATSLMPDTARETLKKIAASLRKAGGIADPAPADPNAPAPAKNDNRASLGQPSPETALSANATAAR